MKPATAPPQQKTQGFTLVELLIVIAVLGVLATIVLLAVNPAGQLARARDAGRKTALKSIANALEAYVAVNGSYPSTNMNWSWESGIYEGPNGWIPNLAPGDIKRLPSDPRKGTPGSKQPNCATGSYGYGYRSDGKDYKIYAHCTPENYSKDDRKFIDPWRDADATYGGDGRCGDPVAEGENGGVGDGMPWSWAIWSSDTSKCW
ncbi:MAG: hypothetical protein A2953_01415 [Candidatus Levybacteria bacterium RIFCSPLOWO2_01_FULL_36_54]|nr:MAG: hypothetical protein A2953_01415 [Candidatus Levybacteria bacterium RIFCSPLOWO2_01_FULL_36_54]